MVTETEVRTVVVPLRKDLGGALRVGNTRVTLETVMHHFNQGAAPEEIVYRFPTLNLADVYAVIAYYLTHRAEVEAYLRQAEQEAEEVRRKIEAELGSQEGLRERLLARRAGSQQQ